MDFLVCFFILALDFRAFGFNYQYFAKQNPNNVEVVNYNAMGSGSSCPKIVQPLCATNGGEFLYFENKCQLEVKNYDQLIQGLMEYIECPLSFCKPNCGKCSPVNEPVCAVNIFTGELLDFRNPCEVERRICTTQQDWQIIDSYECNAIKRYNAKTSSKNSECPEFCTLEYQPICARFMSLEKEFSNECELKTTVCQTKQKWHIVKQGPCQQSNYNAAAAYSPVYIKLQNQPEQDWSRPTGGQKYEMHSKLNTKVELPPQKIKCSEICSSEYTPVCAKSDNELREFLNTCELEKTICETKENWQLFKKGRCPLESESLSTCPNLCTKRFSPICARYNGELREFFNSCEFQKSACETNIDWELINTGPCRYNKQKSFCQNKNLDPICAVYGLKNKTFNNICQLEEDIKSTGNDWSILHKGICNNPNPASSWSTSAIGSISSFTTKATTETSYTATYEPSYTPTANTEITEGTTNKTDFTTTPRTITLSTTKNIIKTTTIDILETTNAATSTTTAVPETTKDYLANTSTTIINENNSEQEESQNSSNSYEDSSSSSDLDDNLDDLYGSWEDKEYNDSHSYESQCSENDTKAYRHNDDDASYNKSSHVNGNNFANFYEGLSNENETSLETYEINTKESLLKLNLSDEKDVNELLPQPNDCSDDKSKETKDVEKYHTQKQETFSAREGSISGPSSIKKYQKEFLNNSLDNISKNLKDIDKNHPPLLKIDKSGESKSPDEIPNLINSRLQKYFNRKHLIKLIENRIQALFGVNKNADSSEESSSDESNSIESKANSKSISDESLEENISYENHLIDSEEFSYGYGSTTSKENAAKFGIHSDQADDGQNQAELNYFERQNIYKSPVYETTLKGNDRAEVYSTQSVAKFHNYEKHNSKEKSEEETEGNGTEIKKLLTAMQMETTTNYPNYEVTETEVQLNDNNFKPSHSKYNSTNSKKNEIYNGVVYKAPFYDAPTYNFIYTGPQHPALSLYYNDLKTNPGANHNDNALEDIINQVHSAAAANIPLGPLTILPQSAHMPDSFVMENGSHILDSMQKLNNINRNPVNTEYNQSKLSPAHSSSHLFLPISPEHFTSFLNPLIRSIAPPAQSFPPPHLALRTTEVYENNQNPEEYYKDLASRVAKETKLPTIPSKATSHLQEAQSKFFPITSHKEPNTASQPYLQQPLAKQYSSPLAPGPGNSPPSSLNMTLLNQIMETLRAITR